MTSTMLMKQVYIFMLYLMVHFVFLRISFSDDDETSASAASPTPKRGEVMQAMQTLRYFLEKSGADLKQFYTLERQLL